MSNLTKAGIVVVGLLTWAVIEGGRLVQAEVDACNNGNMLSCIAIEDSDYLHAQLTNPESIQFLLDRVTAE